LNQDFLGAAPAAPHWQRSLWGTCPRTCSTWAPQPAQPGRPQLLQVI